MGKGLTVLLTVGLVAFVTCMDPKQAWWKSATIYQLYVRSFRDSDGDGVGDLKGIINSIDYIKDLGVEAVWLSPIYKSPNVDFGYDVSDFTSIQPQYGTMDDFKQLLGLLKNSSIKLLMDFVPNHTSDEHDWFVKSRKREGKYTDYYVWLDPGSVTRKGKEPPTNWVSVMDGSAWKFDSNRNQYYLHQFFEKQPDLNYRNPDVLESMKDAMKFWLDLGVSGFRMDAVFTIWESSFADEPRIGNLPKDEYSSYQHIYTAEQPGTFKVLREFRKVLDNYSKGEDERIMFTESYAPTVSDIVKYYGSKSEPIAHFPFNFMLLMNMNKDSTAKDWEDEIMNWYNGTEGFWSNWVMGNHDNHRVASRFTHEYADIVNMIIFTLKGTVVTYNGEELGMQDSYVRIDQAKDPQGKKHPKTFMESSRDPERGPFSWNKDENAGFSKKSTWLPPDSNYWQINAEDQNSTEISHLNIYKKLVSLRKEYTLKFGGVQVASANKTALVICRELKDHMTVATVVNFSYKNITVDLEKIRSTLPDEMYPYVTSVNFYGKDDGANNMTEIDIRALKMNPLSGIVLTTAKLH